MRCSGVRGSYVPETQMQEDREVSDPVQVGLTEKGEDREGEGTGWPGMAMFLSGAWRMAGRVGAVSTVALRLLRVECRAAGLAGTGVCFPAVRTRELEHRPESIH